MSKLAPITRRDILGPRLYEPAREDYRKRVMALKRARRVDVGDRVFLVFENRDTLKFQIEEMLRAEHISDDAKMQEEIDVYNSLMPDEGSLSATLFLSVAPGEEARETLHRFIGIDEHVILEIGPHKIRAAFEPGRQEGDRISAVQYTRYPLSPEARAALLQAGTRVAVAIDHPNYTHTAVLSEDARASLAADYQR